MPAIKVDNPAGPAQSLTCPPGFQLVGSSCVALGSASNPTPSSPVVPVTQGTFVAAPITVQTMADNGVEEDIEVTIRPVPPPFPWGWAAAAVGIALFLGRK